MADLQRSSPPERDVDQAITALKKGAQLLKYGRRGKPKFCPFRLSNDESMLIWYSGKDEKHLKLNKVTRIVPGQRTAIFQRYPRPDKEYQSFSLMYDDRSLDLVCKDKDEAEIWFVALKALISRGNYCRFRCEASDSISSDSPKSHNRRSCPSVTYDPGDTRSHVPFENIPPSGFGKAFSELITYTAASKSQVQFETVSHSLSSSSSAGVENSNSRTSAAETFRVSLSSAVSSSSQGSYNEDFDALGDVFIWGEGIGDVFKVDALLPKALESTVVLDVQNIACGHRHAVLVTKQGEVFTWGKESGGRLGHGVEADVSQPKLIDMLSGMNVELVACGEYHTCAVTLSGDLYTWGDGTHNVGLLGHGSEVSHWIPKKLTGPFDGVPVSYISCGPWHTALVTSAGQLFTFGDGTFGALGHGDRTSANIPREVETLAGLRTVKVACGVWHTAAIVEVMSNRSSSATSSTPPSGKLFTWGDGDKCQLGHGNKQSKLVPHCVSVLGDECFCQVACGCSLTVGLTTSGRVYTMGSPVYGQLGNPLSTGMIPSIVEGRIANNFVEEIACGSYHVAVLTSKTELYTWGKGAHGQLGHGDTDDRNVPALVDFLKDKQVKTISCGSNFTAAICLHKWVSSADHSVCSGCHLQFGFRRKRHNCYNCGLVFCKACSSKKSTKASLAPNMNKRYRVCDDCFTKIKKAIDGGSVPRLPRVRSGTLSLSTDSADKEGIGPRLQGQISRLLSVGSFNQRENCHPKGSLNLQRNDTRVFPTMNGNYQLKDSYSAKASTSKVLSASVPGSRTISRATSPNSAQSSPPQSKTLPKSVHSTEAIVDVPKQSNENLTREIIMLRSQVEELTCKSQQLEAELERTVKHLQEVSAVAADEAEKNKIAKEVIMSLTSQLKEMAEKVPEAQSSSHIATIQAEGHTFAESEAESNSVNTISSGRVKVVTDMVNTSSSNGAKAEADRVNTSSSIGVQAETDMRDMSLSSGVKDVTLKGNTSSLKGAKAQSAKVNTNTSNGAKSESEKRSMSLPSGTKAETDKVERVVQHEQGIYVTLSSSHGGGNELKRVRFSRKRFTEEQAEKWWADNGAKVCEKYNIRVM